MNTIQTEEQSRNLRHLVSPIPREYRNSSTTTAKFRFKKQHRAARSRSRSPPPLHSEPSHDHRHHHKSRRRHRRPYRSDNASSAPADQQDPAVQASPPPSPETAFRESLFDALADEEGAAYWEAVYGQPIHTYSREYRRQRPTPRDGEGNGFSEPVVDAEGRPVFELMTNDEYAAYVRARMWEKSHGHVVEERERRRQEREREKERDAERARKRKETRDRLYWEDLLDPKRRPPLNCDDLGEIGRMGKSGGGGGGGGAEAGESEETRWQRRWASYLHGWQDLDLQAATIAAAAAAEASSTAAERAIDDDRNDAVRESRKKSHRQRTSQIPWPVASGRLRDISPTNVEEFYRQISAHATASLGSSASAPAAAAAVAAPSASSGALPKLTQTERLAAVLKVERVRWHPDKMVQRYGGVLGLTNSRGRDRTEGSGGGGASSMMTATTYDSKQEHSSSRRDGVETLAAVTAVFQIVDRLWSGIKEAKIQEGG